MRWLDTPPIDLCAEVPDEFGPCLDGGLEPRVDRNPREGHVRTFFFEDFRGAGNEVAEHRVVSFRQRSVRLHTGSQVLGSGLTVDVAGHSFTPTGESRAVIVVIEVAHGSIVSRKQLPVVVRGCT